MLGYLVLSECGSGIPDLSADEEIYWTLHWKFMLTCLLSPRLLPANLRNSGSLVEQILARWKGILGLSLSLLILKFT